MRDPVDVIAEDCPHVNVVGDFRPWADRRVYCRDCGADLSDGGAVVRLVPVPAEERSDG